MQKTFEGRDSLKVRTRGELISDHSLPDSQTIYDFQPHSRKKLKLKVLCGINRAGDERMSEKKGADSAPEEQQGREAARARRRRRRIRALRDLLVKLILLALVVYVLFFHLVGLTVMPSGDMYPRLDAGDLILFYRLEENLKAQDIVVIDKAVNRDFSAVNSGRDAEEDADLPEDAEETTETPEPEKREVAEPAEKPWWRRALTFLKVPDPDEPETTRFVCRVVAAPGDTVEIADGSRLLVNGNAMIESGIFYQTTEYVGFVEYPITLGEDEYFVLADYRNGGADSRFFGPVKRNEIQGVVITIMRRNNL